MGERQLNVHQFVRVWLAPISVVDIVTAQNLVGYASPLTTSKYDRRGEEVKRQALQSTVFISLMMKEMMTFLMNDS